MCASSARLFACGEPRGKGADRHMIYCISQAARLYAAAMAQRSIRSAGSTGSRWACRACAWCIASRPRSLLGLVASAGGVLGKPIIHEVGLSLAMIIGAIALGRGVREHGFGAARSVGALGLGIMAYALTPAPRAASSRCSRSLGVLILALGHRLNIMASGTARRLIACPRGGRGLSLATAMARHDHQLHEGEALHERRARAADARGRAMDRHARGGVRRAGELRQAGERL